ncbi:MAG: hypothetical protein QXL35_03295 [Candidatus Bathyarchaeia archaeon]
MQSPLIESHSSLVIARVVLWAALIFGWPKASMSSNALGRSAHLPFEYY